MIETHSPFVQTLLGTLFTWGFTAAGAAVVFFFNGYKRSFLDASLGFAAGVMTAASFWSLLLPAIEIAEHQYGEDNKFVALIPIVVGFVLGALFVYLADIFLPDDIMQSKPDKEATQAIYNSNESINYAEKGEKSIEINLTNMRQRTVNQKNSSEAQQKNNLYDDDDDDERRAKRTSEQKSEASRFRKIILLIIAVTIHNIPEGLAVGVGFGAVGKTGRATFQNARNLALGIGIQNFPEGLAVSLPLYAAGHSSWKAFWYGQLSGMVEPLAGLLGLVSVSITELILPYALAFAAGAMIFVVFENIVPECSAQGNGKLASWFCILGFTVMMMLDVGLD